MSSDETEERGFGPGTGLRFRVLYQGRGGRPTQDVYCVEPEDTLGCREDSTQGTVESTPL